MVDILHKASVRADTSEESSEEIKELLQKLLDKLNAWVLVYMSTKETEEIQIGFRSGLVLKEGEILPACGGMVYGAE